MMKSSAKTTGLRYWMLRVLDECKSASAGFAADPVHDLRVALRRCRSMADGMMAMDPDPEWKAMKKAGKRLFQRLGDLRDVQIMMDWIDQLHPPVARPAPEHSQNDSGAEVKAQNGPAPTAEDKQVPAEEVVDPAQALRHLLRHRESQHKHEARAALEAFDPKQWRQWAKSLPQRAAHIRPGSAVFRHLALERWTAARELHTRALRNRSQVAFHTLRIGIKRFRYIVENFLPVEHKGWSDDLKHMQDLLGEVHDLDVLWATALSSRVFPDASSRQRWHERILKERTKRIEEYRERTSGPESLWNVWRAGLPKGKQIRDIATRRMKLWGKALDPDFAHSERVARLALELYDGLEEAGLLSGLARVATNGTHAKPNPAARARPEKADENGARASLYAAALLHDVGKARGEKGHHKESLDLIKKHPTPLGWNEDEIQRAALVARFHCGALPTRSHKNLRDLLPDEQRMVIRLCAILRLANALDALHDGHVRRVKLENVEARHQRRTNGFIHKPALARNEALVIAAEGFADGTPTAQAVAGERYLLETVLRRPVIVRAIREIR